MSLTFWQTSTISLKVISKIRPGSDLDPHLLMKLNPDPRKNSKIRSGSAVTSGVHRIFERGGGGARRVARNLEREIKTRWDRWRLRKKKEFTQIQLVFQPRFRWRPKKKDLHSYSVGFSTHIFCLNSKGEGGHGSILRTILRYFYIPGNPKGVHAAMPPLNTPMVATSAGRNWNTAKRFIHFLK